MMHIDTNKAVNQLIKTGVKKETAEIFVEIIELSHKSNVDSLATKQDIFNLELKIADVKTELGKEIADVKADVTRLDGKVDKLQWMVTFNVGLLVVVLGVVLKIAFSH